MKPAEEPAGAPPHGVAAGPPAAEGDSPWAATRVQELMEHLQALTGLANAIIAVDGKVLAASGWQELCTRFHRVHPETCRYCTESDVYLSTNLNQGHSALYRCKNGLYDMATPLVVDGQHLANVFTGQFLLEGEPLDVEGFEARAARHGFDREAYLAALARIPRVSEERARQVMAFQAALARVLVQLWRAGLAAREAAGARARAEELRTASHYVRSLIEASLDPLVTISPEGKITDVNRATEEATGRRREELVGTDFADYFTEPERAREGYRRVLQEGRVTDYALTIRHCSGGTADVLYNASTYRNEAGELQGVFAAARDVTERKRVEHALQAERDRVQAILEASPVGMMRVRSDGRFDYANTAAQQLLGLQRSALEDRGYDAPEWCLTDWEGHPVPPEKLAISRAMRTGKPALANTAFIRPDGKRLLLTVRAAPIHDAAGRLEGAIAGIEDATERRRLEDQLRQAQKLEAVGRLAGGIAHDFNNLLTAILSGSDALLSALAERDPLREEAKDIHEAAFRASTLTRQLLTFSRKQVVQPTLVDLWEVVAGLERMLRRLLGEDVELATRGGPGARVRVDPGQMEQVIVNLAVNARDAMPRGGKLVLETSGVELDEEAVAAHPGLEPGRWVLLTVSDTGSGMTPEVKAHLFEPFFTTRPAGKGTGLGLSTVYGIVTQAGGHVWIYSEPGVGTVVKVLLPRVEAELPARRPEAAAEAPRGTETVLVVEDERLVRKLTVKVLAAAGYRVLEAGDGEEALAAAGKAERISALVTDVVMPRLRGDELAVRMRAIHPGLRVLFVSGYTEPGVALQEELQHGSAFLPKPFAAAALVRRLRGLLDEPAYR
ncbi:MAG: PocR ligand-binding domain-containing protein [Deltaproteobacteria bacterium]|nr:PocR ligand-binding domain-containing protein [Deltaproteobacteria bacterium]